MGRRSRGICGSVKLRFRRHRHNEVTATNPTYTSNLDLNNIPTSALGFNYTFGVVDTQIRKFISDFRHSSNAAAVTADVVAHSMGGDVVRTMALEPWFASNDTYGHGPIDKLITIGTPHLGSPLAVDLLQDANQCVREQLSKDGHPSFLTVTTSAGPINGAVGDLQGDGFGGSLSAALQQLFDAGPLPFPMARVSAITSPSNLSGLDCSPPNCLAWRLRNYCAPDPLATSLTSTGWISVFGQYNDAVVPILSQLNGGTAQPNTLTGVIHSPGLETLDFSPPTELDGDGPVPATVLNLLNEPPNGSDFQ